MFRTVYLHFEGEGYFQEAFGYHCVDAGFVPGTLGHDLQGEFILTLGRGELWPVLDRLDDYSDSDLFDVIEFLYDHCSKPITRDYHGWNDCGWHCKVFETAPGQAEFREKLNRFLPLYQDGFELSIDGEVLRLPESGLEGLVEAPLPTVDPENIEAHIGSARRKYRRHGASLDERRDAIRDLADVLEFLRPKLKGVLLSADDADLFNLANNFAIRHHNELQKARYDRAIWYSWLFYFYLATIHAVLRLIAKGDKPAA